MSSHLHHPVCIVHDYVILNVCKISLSFSPCLSLPLACTLFQPSSKKGDFIPPADLWYTPFLRLHASYITRLKQGCCNERYLEGTRSLRNSSICYREDFAHPQLKAKLQCDIKTIYISSSHAELWGHFVFKSPCETGTTLPNLDISDYSWRLQWLQSLSSGDRVKQSQLHTS